MAMFACSNQEDALDLVQDSMCRFVDKYADKPSGERRALFYRILQNRIKDHYRYQSIRSRWQVWFGTSDDNGDSGDESDWLEQAPDTLNKNPEQQTTSDQAITILQGALQRLPYRQQQVFLLRCWEELTVTETAQAMGCSEGSVKTHLSRALQALKKLLGKDWP